jgi:hypothetical protein
LDLAHNRIALLLNGSAEIEIRLEPKEEGGGNAEIALGTQGCIRGYTFAPGKNIGEPAAWNLHITSCLSLREVMECQCIFDEACGWIRVEVRCFHEWDWN